MCVQNFAWRSLFDGVHCLLDEGQHCLVGVVVEHGGFEQDLLWGLNKGNRVISSLIKLL